MPYNNTPIQPSKDATGNPSLPLARVKKIIHADDDIQSCSNNAAFLITFAAEFFIQYMVEQTHIVAKTDKKPRRNIQYKDVASAVSRVDNLDFLADVVPRTVPFKQTKKKSKDDKKKGSSSKAVAGEPTIAAAPAANGRAKGKEAATDTEEPAEQSTDEMDVDEPDPEDKAYRGATKKDESSEMEMETRTRSRLSKGGRASLNEAVESPSDA